MKTMRGASRSLWLLGLSTVLIAGISTPGLFAAARGDNPLRSRSEETRSVADEPAAPSRAASLLDVTSAPRPVADQGVRQAAYTSSTRPRTTARPASLSGQGVRQSARSFVPRHEMMAGYQPTESVQIEPVPACEPEVLGFGGLPGEGEYLDPDCGVEVAGPCTTCGAATGCLIPCPQALLARAEFMTGVHGFTGPVNRGETGSFGFDWGVNWAAPMPCSVNQAIGIQFGYHGTSSNYSGASFTTDTRNQTFLTGGLFRRVDWGLQGGIVFDYLYDEWYMDASVSQLRGELSWVYPQCHEVGFWFTASSGGDTVQSTLLTNGQLSTTSEQVETVDIYAFFYRRRFQQWCGGTGRIYAGFTGDSDGIIGADFRLPLSDDWAVQSGFTYLIPESGNNRIALQEEAWNIGINLIWYPGQRKATGNDYFRPLFDVADNGSMIVKRN